MGLFGGSTSKSYSTTIQEDHRVIAEEAEILAGSGANVVVSYPQSVAVSPYAEVGDIVVQPYSPEVRQTVSELIETVQLVSTKTIPVLAETFGESIYEAFQFGERTAVIAAESSQRTAELAAEASQRAAELAAEAGEQAAEIAAEAGEWAAEKSAAASQQATEFLGEKLRETQLGQAAILPGIAKYLVLAAVIIVVAGKVWK